MPGPKKPSPEIDRATIWMWIWLIANGFGFIVCAILIVLSYMHTDPPTIHPGTFVGELLEDGSPAIAMFFILLMVIFTLGGLASLFAIFSLGKRKTGGITFARITCWLGVAIAGGAFLTLTMLSIGIRDTTALKYIFPAMIVPAIAIVGAIFAEISLRRAARTFPPPGAMMSAFPIQNLTPPQSTPLPSSVPQSAPATRPAAKRPPPPPARH